MNAIFQKRGNILVLTFLLMGLYLVSLYNFLLFHSLVELFSVIIACGIFIIAWNYRDLLNNNYLLFLGIAYLFVGGFDLLHTLSYKGMGIFPAYDANLPTQIWIAGRFVESSSLLAAGLIGTKFNPRHVFSGYLAVFSLLLISIFFSDIFPACFIEGVGLTQFKIVSEYLISSILIISIYLLFKKRSYMGNYVFPLLVASIILTVISELFFTLYIDVYDFFNLLGHIFKFISFYLIYEAVVVAGLSEPHNIMFRDLKRSNELKDSFTDIMHHDLLNPANVVRGYSELLIDTEMDGNKVRMLEKVKRSNEKIIEIIESASKFAKLESVDHLEVKVMDIGSILRDVVDGFEPRLNEKRMHMEFHADGTYLARVNPIIEEVFSNLVSNAIKYSPQGSRVIIDVSDKGNKWLVRVTDFGDGIPDEDKGKVFERFKRVGNNSVKGTGLGLAIVQRIVDMHGGAFGVEDNPMGQGSVFWVTLNKT